MATFELAVLSMLREVDTNEVLGETSPATEIAALERQLAWLADRQAELAAELRNGDIAAIAQQLRELKAEETEAVAKLEEARQLAAKPLSSTWRDISTLIDAAADPDVRLRLRFAISRVVDSIHLLVVARGRDRLAYCQCFFRGGKAFRTFRIEHCPPHANDASRKPGRWRCYSVQHATGKGQVDLRQREWATYVVKQMPGFVTDPIEDSGWTIGGVLDADGNATAYDAAVRRLAGCTKQTAGQAKSPGGTRDRR
jgi:hypothetical protein